MGRLIPEDFDITTLPSEAEGRVVVKFVESLPDEWLVMPSVPIVMEGRHAEIDVVLLSPRHGVVLVETKGGPISIRDGEWFSADHKLKRSPFKQVADAKFQLLRRARQAKVPIGGLQFHIAVAMPDVLEIPAGGMAPDAPRESCLGRLDLDYADHAIGRLARPSAPAPDETMRAVLRMLRPTLDASLMSGQYMGDAGRRIDANTNQFLHALYGLDENRRFLVLGGAGTGKTMLARRWASRAVTRGERVLFVCFNRPLADESAGHFDDIPIELGTLQSFAVRSLEPLGCAVPEGAGPSWWESELPEQLRARRSEIDVTFDTIIVDEAQDFHPSWIETLETFLDPSGPARMLMVADPQQVVYDRQWQAPEGIPRLRLPLNLRNSREIASELTRFGGAEVNSRNPEGPSVIRRTASEDTVASVVGELLRHVREELHVVPAQIAVLVRHRSLQARLMSSVVDGPPLVEWEGRSEETILCETIHRTKGLERAAVIVVDLDADRDPVVEYVALSRPTLFLAVVSADPDGDRVSQ